MTSSPDITSRPAITYREPIRGRKAIAERNPSAGRPAHDEPARTVAESNLRETHQAEAHLVMSGEPNVSLQPTQTTFDNLGTRLADTTFVVVDLETTGGSAKDCHITEIGAVKTQGGIIQGEFQTLVNPGVDIPPFIASLTGITNATIAGAPDLATALPMYLDFAAGSVMVAHNAGFDASFLKAACRALDYPWPQYTIVDTVRLARVLLHRDEVPNKKLATLARHFKATTTPTHRALDDARATVDVLHGLLERAGSYGAHHIEDLAQLTSRVTSDQRIKRSLADDLPDSPGIYVFKDRQDKPLYVGKSKSIRTRARNYFTASEKRKRIAEMVRIAERIDAIVCATELEAEVHEVRLIAEHKPPYNRRSRSPEKVAYLKLTNEPFPRLSVVNRIALDKDPELSFAGPFSSKAVAESAKIALLATYPQLRTCTTRLSRGQQTSPCAAAQLGSCLAPCADIESWPDYEEVVGQVRQCLAGDANELYRKNQIEMAEMASSELFERAASRRDQLRTMLSGLHKAHQFRALGKCTLLVAAKPVGAAWDLHVIRHGRLAGASVLLPSLDTQMQLDNAIEKSQPVEQPTDAPTSASAEESNLILKWLFSDGVRLARVDGSIFDSVDSPARFLEMIPRPAARSTIETRQHSSSPAPIPAKLRSRLAVTA
jgi:DNA polymerase-3 subunit epsilon